MYTDIQEMIGKKPFHSWRAYAWLLSKAFYTNVHNLSLQYLRTRMFCLNFFKSQYQATRYQLVQKTLTIFKYTSSFSLVMQCTHTHTCIHKNVIVFTKKKNEYKANSSHWVSWIIFEQYVNTRKTEIVLRIWKLQKSIP